MIAYLICIATSNQKKKSQKLSLIDTTSQNSLLHQCSRLKLKYLFPDHSIIYSVTAEDKGISLIGHSAGGWLARVYMEKFGFSDISLLLTLGSPHLYDSITTCHI